MWMHFQHSTTLPFLLTCLFNGERVNGRKQNREKKQNSCITFHNIVEESNGSLMQFLLDWLQLLTLPQKRHRSTHELMPNTDRWKHKKLCLFHEKGKETKGLNKCVCCSALIFFFCVVLRTRVERQQRTQDLRGGRRTWARSISDPNKDHFFFTAVSFFGLLDCSVLC